MSKKSTSSQKTAQKGSQKSNLSENKRAGYQGPQNVKPPTSQQIPKVVKKRGS
jgi:hypothetical protein